MPGKWVGGYREINHDVVMTAENAPQVHGAEAVVHTTGFAAGLLQVDARGVVQLGNLPAAWKGKLPETIEAALESARRGERETFDMGEMGPSGPLSWYKGEAFPAPEGGACVVFVDVTDQKRENERLRRAERLLVDTQGVAHLGTWEWDISEPHAFWSDELYRIYGLTPETYTPSYEAYLEMVHPDDRQRVIDATNAVFKEHVPYSHDERIFQPDGTMKYLHTWAMPILDDAGKLVRLVGVCQDVTEARLADRAVRAQTLTRGLARRIVLELMQRSHVSPGAVRELGKALSNEPTGDSSLESAVANFVAMGLGQIKIKSVEGQRFAFAASDLLERRASATMPTCDMTLGYLEGAVSRATGATGKGNEMRCQSMGHEECVFVIKS